MLQKFYHLLTMQFILGVHCMQQFSLSVKYTNEAAEPG